jgi:hypothetical protein
LPVFQAGSSITALALDQFCVPQSVIKPADTSRTSTTTLANDPALVLPVLASATYLFDSYLDYEGGTLGSSDLKLQWNVPSGAALRYWLGGLNTSGTNISSNTFTDGAAPALGSGGAAVLKGVLMKGTLVMSSTAGNLQLQWAQNTSSGTATIVHAQSYVTLWRIS